ncbi:MAG TPA: mevalonate kinase [Polyangiaceae bacterium]|jgi:mevalonate kinase|nr:mevalonate kinase [Polyangiaceae bacterium]
MHEGRASGKVILVGEHAVVYGVPAIAVGIERGARARAVFEGDTSELRLAVMGAEPVRAIVGEGDEPVNRAFAALLFSCGVKRPVRVEAHADLPAGAGLGCSAALGVAIARAVVGVCTDAEARTHATAWERVFHGNPSGVDAAVAALGGAIVFERNESDKPPSIEPLEFGTQLVLAIGHSGVSSSTKTMVESVARQRERSPDLVRKTFEGITAISRNARLAIEAGDVVALGKLLDMNQMLLAGLLLSTQEIETLCACAREAGALGAKLTGAGGGGCVVALAESHASAEVIVEAWKKDGFTGFVTEAGNRELRVKRARVAAGGA